MKKWHDSSDEQKTQSQDSDHLSTASLTNSSQQDDDVSSNVALSHTQEASEVSLEEQDTAEGVEEQDTAEGVEEQDAVEGVEEQDTAEGVEEDYGLGEWHFEELKEDFDFGERVERHRWERIAEEDLDDTNPRKEIRQFLRKTFDFIGYDLPAEWPDVSPSEYAKLVMILREHLEELYYLSESQKTILIDKRLMPRFLGETILYLMQLDWERPESFNQPSKEVVELLGTRPEAIIEYDQLYCTPDSTERRIERILQDFGEEHHRVLFLGDDDMGSVVLAPRFKGEVHMMDLDDRIHEAVAEKAPSVIRHKVDFVRGGVPMEFYQTFDAVVLDPPWDFYRLWCFLDKAMFCLKDDLNARIYWSYCPLHLENRERKMHLAQKRMVKRGFTFEAIEPVFNLYSLSPDVLPELQTRLDGVLPNIESPLLDFIRYIPYVHSQLFVLRRLPFFKQNRFRKWFFLWWNTK